MTSPTLAPTTPSCPIIIDTSGEPYIPIPSHPELKLTMRKESDIDDLLVLFNTPEIGKWFWRRPFPYKLSDADFFMSPIPRFSTYLSTTLIPSLPFPPSPSLPHAENFFPFPVLRTASDGKMIGIVFLSPASEDEEGEEGIWELAYDLLPAWWGKGVGTGMINAGLGYLKWIGAKKVKAFHEPENAASGAVLCKTGFTRVEDKKLIWPEEKGGGERVVYGWEKKL
ncbi:hypothetical protein C366_03334 [Cryptococcus neoformans Tu401-1]|nr:hypothetical protein C365_03493 [Cryptococcus neoformans var. grubii Bt85]OXG17249.1 hypothetical protein C366_03334 [Cryptococcus neoformans var. grubii Tu401-1]OXM78826.1 hypothetical protein C364_03299 [Cryptococcus neoformans var. grubii Bt63]